MKKILTLIAVLTLTLTLVGCKTEVDDSMDLDAEYETGASLVVWMDNEDWANELITAFNVMYPDIELTFEEKGAGDVRADFELHGPSGEAADVAVAPHDQVGTLANQQLILSLEDMKDIIAPRVLDSARSAATIGGELYAVPVSVEAVLMMVNADMVDPDDLKSMDDIVALSSEFTNAANNEYTMMWEATNGYFGYAMLTPFNYRLFGESGEDGSNPGFDQQEFIDGLEYLESLRSPLFNVDAESISNDFLKSSFIDGKTPIIIDGPWNFSAYTDAGVNYVAMAIPEVNGVSPTPFGGVQSAVVNSYTDYPKASKLFVEFLSTSEAAQILYDETLKVPAVISGGDLIAANPNAVAVFEQFKTAFPMPSITEMSYYWGVVGPVLTATWNGDLTPEQAAEKAQTDFEAAASLG